MNIAHFLWEFPPVIKGGLGTFGMEVTQKQRTEHNDITVFSLNEDNRYKEKEIWNDITVFRPYLPDATTMLYLAANNELRSWGTYFKFYADVMVYNLLSADQLINTHIRKHNHVVDILHSHDWLGLFGGIIAKKELEIPLIFHVHSTEVGRSNGGGSTSVKEIEFEGGQSADAVITVSHAMKEELIHLGFPEKKIQVVWNGVDPTKYDPARISQNDIATLRKQYGVSQEETLIFFIGRLVTIKGADKLVACMPTVLKEFPKTKLVLLGIGDMEMAIQKQISDLELENKIILRDEFVDENQRILHYAASDLVVLPSLYEPFGIVCTEAMAMGKPVVVGAYGTNGMREQIIPYGKDQCGIHVNPFKSEDIAWGICEILRRDDKGKSFGENGRKRVLQEFGWKIVAERIQNVYQNFV
ncbi:MAG: glycosyltransferase family 4 protein [Candidatus Thermoplasmatota archaeon]|nr:glycosyltransferase family 4 protein [Candidatus Thermoplasmatota archaeon]MBU1941987.1 glycosyltransferase family 4 protein [Candidatus Thermoplasmatota archaeon]